ncbi:hypothetical protein Pse7367_3574 [Thalassoporum mexicanum PCC 7367]|nr:hypothetical protein Pse7367_3574 [Pseudanabaena sp. PCC 7367]
MGWIQSHRQGNVGGIGNTLEDLLGIPENNLPIPNAAEWELKCQRINNNSVTSSLTTLFHMEPSPRALKFVPSIFLPKYGWPHKQAGGKYPSTEMSFRQTINAVNPTDRGFKVVIDKVDRKVLISFDSKFVSEKHSLWLDSVEQKIGLGQLSPQPYWGFDDLFHKAGTKLHNCFFVGALRKKEKTLEFFKYDKILMLSNFSLDRFIQSIEEGDTLVDFDARTGHNHGTKFRFRQSRFEKLYSQVQVI